jgi:proteasome lid subunit RPN8/RPN11
LVEFLPSPLLFPMKIEASLLRQLTEQAVLARPLECCGLLWSQGGGPIVDYTPYPGPLYRQRFEMEDNWLLQQHYSGRRMGRVVKGYYHSHPNSRALPSPGDVAGHPSGSLCLIVTPDGEARAFRLDKGIFQEQVVEQIAFLEHSLA